MSEELQQETRKPTKHELKKAQWYQERRQRLLNKGVPEDQVDLVIAREDYEALPVEKKIRRLESMIQGLAQGASQDINGLVENDKLMADAYDINIRACRKLFQKLGITSEEFQAISEQVEAEFIAEKEAKTKARKDAQEKAAMEEALKQESDMSMSSHITGTADREPQLHTHPEIPSIEIPHPEATTFGD